MPKHRGAAGRINIIGTLASSADKQQLEYQVLEERCSAQHVKTYLEALAQQAQCLTKEVVVVLDNAGFHRANLIKTNTIVGRLEDSNFGLILPRFHGVAVKQL